MFSIIIELIIRLKSLNEVDDRRIAEFSFVFSFRKKILADRRAPLEGPIPGYQGYIPRMIPIGVGLGAPYRQAAQKALNRFAIETSNSTTNFSASADNDSLPDYANRAK